MWNQLRDWIRAEIRAAVHELNYPMNLEGVKRAAAEAEQIAKVEVEKIHEAVNKLTSSATAPTSAPSSPSTSATSDEHAPDTSIEADHGAAT